MSNLLIISVKPFTTTPDELPTQLGLKETLGLDVLQPSGVDKKGDPVVFNGKISQLANGLTRVQYIPSDSPYFAHIHGKDWARFYNPVNYDPFESMYTVNKQGFRAPNFKKSDGKNAVMFLGDSFTYGVGVRDTECYPHIVSDKLGKVNWNIGCGGISDKEQLYLLDHFISLGYIPSQVVFTWGETHRKLLMINKQFSKNSVMGYRGSDVPITESNILEQSIKLAKTWSPTWELSPDDNTATERNAKAWALTYEDDMYIDLYDIRVSLQKTCKLHNIPLLEVHNHFPSAVFCYNMDGNPPSKHRSDYIDYHMGSNPDAIQELYPHRDYIEMTESLNLPAKQGGDWGRDNHHWGPIKHNLAAHKVLTLLESQKK